MSLSLMYVDQKFAVNLFTVILVVSFLFSSTQQFWHFEFLFNSREVGPRMVPPFKFFIIVKNISIIFKFRLHVPRRFIGNASSRTVCLKWYKTSVQRKYMVNFSIDACCNQNWNLFGSKILASFANICIFFGSRTLLMRPNVAQLPPLYQLRSGYRKTYLKYFNWNRNEIKMICQTY